MFLLPPSLMHYQDLMPSSLRNLFRTRLLTYCLLFSCGLTSSVEAGPGRVLAGLLCMVGQLTSSSAPATSVPAPAESCSPLHCWSKEPVSSAETFDTLAEWIGKDSNGGGRQRSRSPRLGYLPDNA